MKTLKSRKFLFAFIGLLFSSFICAKGRADIKPKTLRLGAQTVFLHYIDGKYSDAEGREIPPAFQNDIEYRNFSFGLGQPRAGVDFAVGVFRNLLVGLNLNLGYETQAFDYENQGETEDQSSFTLQFLPYVEYIFLDGLIRPFVIFTTGVDGVVSESGDVRDSKWAFFLGSGGGVHLFFTDSFSLDFSLIPGLGAGRGKRETDNTDWKYDNIYFDLNISIGLSGWI